MRRACPRARWTCCRDLFERRDAPRRWTSRRRFARQSLRRDETAVLPRDRLLSACGAPTSSICAETVSWPSLLRRIEDQPDGACQRMPFRLFAFELPASSRGETVVPGSLAFVRQRPLRRDPAFGLEPVKGWVQRSRFHLQQVFRRALDVL